MASNIIGHSCFVSSKSIIPLSKQLVMEVNLLPVVGNIVGCSSTRAKFSFVAGALKALRWPFAIVSESCL